MRTRGRLLQVIDKADNGPIVTEAEFDREWIRKPIAGLVKKYDITWPKDTLVPADDALADRVFLAGLELARETGVWCIDTSRRMIFSQRELDEVIEASPSQVVIGEGADTVPMHARRPDENSRVATVGGAYGIPVPENQFTAIMLSYAQEPLIDFIDNASLTSTYGRPIRAGSPLEALACWQECDLSFEAIRRAGRPGMPIGCAENSPSAIGELSSTSYGGFRPTDWHHACFISELKTNYAELTKATHYARTGSHVHTFYNPIYGGYAGGGDGMAVVIVAGMILLQACYHAVTVNPGPSHPFLSCDTHPLMIPIDRGGPAGAQPQHAPAHHQLRTAGRRPWHQGHPLRDRCPDPGLGAVRHRADGGGAVGDGAICGALQRAGGAFHGAGDPRRRKTDP